MKVTKENGDNQQVVLTIEVPVEDWSKAINEAVKRIANHVNIPGFRRGKAPRRIVEQHVGKEAVLDEAYEKVGPKYFNEALKEENLDMATYPAFERVTVEEGKPLVFKAVVTPKPEVKLGEYKGLVIEKKVDEVTDKEVDEHIDKMRERHAELVPAAADAEAKSGDMVTLDFKGFVDGEAFEGGEGKDYPLQIGSNSFIPGFEDQLVGAKVGEEKEVNVTFPEEYHAKDLAGKPAVFKCTIRSIKHKELPEIDDEFAKASSKFQTLDELKADLRKNLEKNEERKADDAQKEKALETATNNTTVDVPPIMIDNEVTRMIREMEMRLAQQGMKLEQYLQFAGTDIAKLRETYRETAEKNVRTGLMLEEVAKAENIKVEGKDLDQEVSLMAAAYGATPKQVKKIIMEQGRLNDLAATVLRNKTMQFIFDNLAE